MEVLSNVMNGAADRYDEGGRLYNALMTMRAINNAKTNGSTRKNVAVALSNDRNGNMKIRDVYDDMKVARIALGSKKT